MGMSFYRKIILTEDGSSTIFNFELNQHYHSIHGAMQESMHVFMKMGFGLFSTSLEQTKQISILEVGFGTGLNAFLVLLESFAEGILSGESCQCVYTSLEAFPLEEKEYLNLNYSKNEKEKKLFLELHEAEWNKEVAITNNFSLHKIQIRLEDFIPEENKFNLIFFDAFSPEAQPELWTEEVFRKLFLSMKKEGILVTYCAKGQVRRNMIAAGFTVERLDGPPGKREMLRARK